MDQSSWSVVLTLILITLSHMVANILSVQITDILLPDTFQEGTKTGMLLDCEYNYTKEDRDSLEIKWYFKQGLTPVYQWIPPNPPQVISPLFQKHLVANFEISSDPFTKYRALNLGNVTTDLSGLYSCRVSSNSGDSFKSKQLTIFSPPKELQLRVVSQVREKTVNVSCSVGRVYPQPSTRLVIISKTGEQEDLSKLSSSSTLWVDGKFNQRTEVILEVMPGNRSEAEGVLRETDVVQCEVRLPGTEYSEVLYRKLVTINTNSSADQPASLLTSFLLLLSILLCYQSTHTDL